MNTPANILLKITLIREICSRFISRTDWVLLSLLTPLLLYASPSQALVILQYHHISDTTPKATSTSPARFAQHLRWINDSGFDVVSLEQVLPLIQKGRPLPDQTVMITFDDSYTSIYDTALPLLKKYQFPFVVFANTTPVEQKNADFLTWPQLKSMTQFGGAIANHTANHPHMLRHLDNETDKQWRKRMRGEIQQSHQLIKKHTGQTHRVLAYPYGEYNQALQSLLKSMGYIGVGQHSGPVPTGEKLAVPRFPMGGDYGNREDFLQKLNTLPFQNYTTTLNLKGQIQPLDPLLPIGERTPTLVLKLDDAQLIKQVNCYLSPGGQLQKQTVDPHTAHFSSSTPLPSGRSRYNCTAPASKDRFYWLSVPFITRTQDGQWAPEP